MRFIASNGVRSCTRQCRATSICRKYFIRHEKITAHNKTNPKRRGLHRRVDQFPDPTTPPAKTIPGPNVRNIGKKPRGADLIFQIWRVVHGFGIYATAI